MLIRSRVLRVFAVVTAVVGLIVFAVLYFRLIEGRLEEALADPRTIVIVLMPFLPAVVISILAERARAKFIDFIQTSVGAAPAASADAKKK